LINCHHHRQQQLQAAVEACEVSLSLSLDLLEVASTLVGWLVVLELVDWISLFGWVVVSCVVGCGCTSRE
jgi:hypothetical protein